MNITHLGHASFLVTANGTSIAMDPHGGTIGLPFPEDAAADVVTISHEHGVHNQPQTIQGNPEIIREAHEPQQIGNVSIRSVHSFHDANKGAERGENEMFVITDDIEHLTVAHLGDLGHILDESQIKAIGRIDILMLPVGGYFTIGPKEAVEVVNQLEPTYVIPMHYDAEGLAIPAKIADVSKFIEAMDLPSEEHEGAWEVTRASADAQAHEGRTVVVLK